MKYTMKVIRSSLSEEKAKIETFWAGLFLRRFSYWLTYPLINIGCSANMVSLISCFVAVIGCIMMCIGRWGYIWSGIILLNMWAVLDCVDGNIARCTKKSSLVGEFFDAMGGYVISAFVLIGTGVAAYNTTVIFYESREFLLILGAVGSVSCMLGKLIYHKYSITIMKIENLKQENKESVRKNENNDKYYSFLKRVVTFFDYEFGIGGDETLFLIIFALVNKIDIFLILYAVYNIFECLMVFAVHAKKMSGYSEMV